MDNLLDELFRASELLKADAEEIARLRAEVEIGNKYSESLLKQLAYLRGIRYE